MTSRICYWLNKARCKKVYIVHNLLYKTEVELRTHTHSHAYFCKKKHRNDRSETNENSSLWISGNKCRKIKMTVRLLCITTFLHSFDLWNSEMFKLFEKNKIKSKGYKSKHKMYLKQKINPTGYHIDNATIQKK